MSMQPQVNLASWVGWVIDLGQAVGGLWLTHSIRVSIHGTLKLVCDPNLATTDHCVVKTSLDPFIGIPSRVVNERLTSLYGTALHVSVIKARGREPGALVRHLNPAILIDTTSDRYDLRRAAIRRDKNEKEGDLPLVKKGFRHPAMLPPTKNPARAGVLKEVRW